MDDRRVTTIIGTLLATAGAGATIYLCFTDAGKKQLRQFEQWLDTGIAETTRMMDSLMVTLSLENLPGPGPFQAHIHAGTCQAEEEVLEGEAETPEPGETPEQDEATADQGRVLVPLEDVTVGALGATPSTPESTPSATTPGTELQGENNGMSMSTIAVSQLQGQQRAFVQVHGEGGQPIACGNIDDLGRATMGAGMGASPSTTPSTPEPGATPGSGANPPGGR